MDRTDHDGVRCLHLAGQSLGDVHIGANRRSGRCRILFVHGRWRVCQLCAGHSHAPHFVRRHFARSLGLEKRAGRGAKRLKSPRDLCNAAIGAGCQSADAAGSWREKPPTDRRGLWDQTNDTPLSSIGNAVTRRLLAAAIALARAGAAGGVPGSPTPVGGSAEGTMCTSISPISEIRSGS